MSEHSNNHSGGKPAEHQPDKGWRRTNKFDVGFVAVGAVLFTLMLFYSVTNPDYSSGKRLVAVIFWTAILGFQVYSLKVVLQKYRMGEDIQKGFFRSVTAKREIK